MKSHYEKVICACCFMTLFVNIGMNSTSFGVYIPYIDALPGVGDVGGSMVLSTRAFVTIVAIAFVDRFYHLLDMRVGMAASILLTALSFFIYHFADGLPLLLVGAVVGGAAYGLGGLACTTMLLNRWFASGIGTAIGIATVGSGVASIVIPVTAASIIEADSLSSAFMAQALFSVVTAVLIFVFVRSRPSEMGLSPHESPKKDVKSRVWSRGSRDVVFSHAERWLVLVAMALTGAYAVGSIAYLSALFVSGGFDTQFAALMLSVAGICLTVAKFVVGELFDHIGTLKASGIVFSIVLVGFALSCLTPLGSPVIAVVSAICIGIGISLGSVGVSVWSLELTSAREREKSVKNCQIAYSVGGLAMNIIPGPLKEFTGTYVTSFAIMLCCAAGAAVVILSLYRKKNASSL